MVAPANKPKAGTPQATLTIDLFWMTSISFFLVEGNRFRRKDGFSFL